MEPASFSKMLKANGLDKCQGSRFDGIAQSYSYIYKNLM